MVTNGRAVSIHGEILKAEADKNKKSGDCVYVCGLSHTDYTRTPLLV